MRRQCLLLSAVPADRSFLDVNRLKTSMMGKGIKNPKMKFSRVMAKDQASKLSQGAKNMHMGSLKSVSFTWMVSAMGSTKARAQMDPQTTLRMSS